MLFNSLAVYAGAPLGVGGVMVVNTFHIIVFSHLELIVVFTDNQNATLIMMHIT